jgi:uncharacterized phage-associated protein
MRYAYFAATMIFTGSVLIAGAALAWDQDPVDQYLHRSDKITLSAGNAKQVNAATHVIDPWPRYVGNRRIPGNGERMAGAAERYRDVIKIPLAPKAIVQAPID